MAGKGRGWHDDSRRHSLSRKGIKTNIGEGRRFDVSNFVARGDFIAGIPYSDKVSFYANPHSKDIIWTHRKHSGKGWFEFIVGDHIEKSRNENHNLTMLREYYPDYEHISLFSETSFHSSITQQNQIKNYGMNDYTLHYSDYDPIEKYNLQKPVMTNRSDMHGEIINEVVLQEWNYIVINWKPTSEGTKLFITHKKSNPFTPVDQGTLIFESMEYDESEKDQAINDFKDYIEQYENSR